MANTANPGDFRRVRIAWRSSDRMNGIKTAEGSWKAMKINRPAENQSANRNSLPVVGGLSHSSGVGAARALAYHVLRFDKRKTNRLIRRICGSLGQLARPANPMLDSRSFRFLLFVASSPFERVCLRQTEKGRMLRDEIEEALLKGAFRS